MRNLKIGILLLATAIVLAACEDNDIMPDYQQKGTATTTVATITPSNAKPAKATNITISLTYVNPGSDPIKTVELKAKVGSSINAGEVAVTIADTSSWLVVTTDVTEIDVVKLKNGQPVTVTLDAIPDVKMRGKVFAIGQNYSENQGDIVYKVTVVLTDINPAMRWGMTAEVKFE